MTHLETHSGNSHRLWVGLAAGVLGVILGGGVRFVIVPAYCTQRADGTFGELYGPVHFAAPFLYGASATLALLGLLLVVSAFKVSRHASTTHA